MPWTWVGESSSKTDTKQEEKNSPVTQIPEQNAGSKDLPSPDKHGSGKRDEHKNSAESGHSTPNQSRRGSKNSLHQTVVPHAGAGHRRGSTDSSHSPNNGPGARRGSKDTSSPPHNAHNGAGSRRGSKSAKPKK